MSDYRYFLGGHDLEMTEIACLVREAGQGDRIVDKHLAWGARASAYLPEITKAIDAGQRPVLIELFDDLPPTANRSELVMIDHHGDRSGRDQPCSLRQVFDLLLGENATVVWTRWRALVAANDIGHARAMRAIGASAKEIRAVRDADRAAQGIDLATEDLSRKALAATRRVGGLLVVETEARTASAIMDFLLPEYGGPEGGPEDTLVIMPETVAFFGRGSVIDKLKSVDGCWFGGALPDEGFWGAARSSAGDTKLLVERIAGLIEVAQTKNN